MQKLIGKAMTLGNVMIGIEGKSLQAHEREWLLHPLVAGVILFSRNYASPEQLRALTSEIHALRHPRLLIAVDHEGGRVQRFRDGFTRLPPMRVLGELYAQDSTLALKRAHQLGWLLATELLACGVDFSFAPVVDLDYGESRVIGDRAFGADPFIVGRLALQVSLGMREAGMASVAKHFPGHGFVQADTHEEVAIDSRTWSQIQQADLQPFLKLMAHSVEAIMPAHVRYPRVDDLPVGFSSHWLQTILRQQCHFDGVIISDDLGMQAAACYGSTANRVDMALKAGCDLALVCNELSQVPQVLSDCHWHNCPLSQARLIRMHGRPSISYASLHYEPIWQAAVKQIEPLSESSLQPSLLATDS